MSPTGAHGSPLLIDEDQVQNVTIAVKEMLSLFTAVTVEDGEHALKKLHCIIDAVYTDLVRRMTSEYRLIEAVKTNSEQLPGSLARSIIIALKNADHKGCESEETRVDLLPLRSQKSRTWQRKYFSTQEQATPGDAGWTASNVHEGRHHQTEHRH
ncbi:hypothetical protein MHYP_G00130950 [Metynnis hypsauchen]